MKKYENFFDCLIIKKIQNNNNNFLLNESYLTLNKEIINFFDFYSFFIFNKYGNLIMYYDNDNNNIQNQQINKKILNYINILTKIVTNIYKNLNKKIKQEIFKFYINENKIIIYYISNIFLVGKFSDKTCNYFGQLLLLHIYISIINYKYDSIEKINLIKDKDYINKYNFADENETNSNSNNINNIFYSSFSNTNINDNNSNNESKNDKSIIIFQDYLELKIYSRIFLKYIILHFISSFKSISQKKQLLLNNIKLKNFYYLNIKSKKIMFDYRKLNQSKICKNFKYYNNELIFNTIYDEAFKIYKKFSDNFPNKNLNENKYYKNINNYFSKIEFTSTYPRLSFFIKFFPCLDGIFIIHVYTQKKLSRSNNSNSNNYYYKHINNKYREFLKIFSNGKEFKYIEPDKLTNIQNFFNNFFMLNIENNYYYYENNNDNNCCYFNKDLINIINNLDRDIILNKNINFICEKIFENLRNYYYYLQKIKEKNENENENSEKNTFNINKYFILYDMFKKNIISNKTFPKYKNEINKNDNKVDLNNNQKYNHTAHNCIVNFDSKISMKNLNGFDANNYSFDKKNSVSNFNFENNNNDDNNNKIISNNNVINKNANSNTYSSNANTSIINLKLSPNIKYRKSTLNFDITMLKDIYNGTDNENNISPELKKRVSGISCIRDEHDKQGSMKEFFNDRKISFFDDFKFNDSSKNSYVNINKSMIKKNVKNNKNKIVNSHNNNNSINVNDTDESLININNESGNNLLINKKNSCKILNKKNLVLNKNSKNFNRIATLKMGKNYERDLIYEKLDFNNKKDNKKKSNKKNLK